MAKIEQENENHSKTPYVEEKPFQFSGKMAKLLGQESVSSEVAALFELVKNAYDADAPIVFIRFKNFGKKSEEKPIIEIEDSGTGMTLNEIYTNWMIIGTYSKDKNQITKKGRRVVGNKGIGRFATEKLASRTKIISKPESSDEEVEVEINWKNYEKEDITFNDVKNIIRVNPNRKNKSQTGIKIILEDLRDPSIWSVEKIKTLKRNISTIIPPKELASVLRDSFSVKVVAPDFEAYVDEDIPSILFEHAPFKLISTISENDSTVIVNLYKKGQKVISDKHIELKGKLPSQEIWKSFGKCKMTVYFYPRSSRFEDWDRWYRTKMKFSDISDHIDDLTGIKLYRDGFWVRPYGEKNNDWLNLEGARVQANLKVGNSQVIGFIETSKDLNPNIIDTTTRERVVENVYFESLQKFANKSIDVLSRFRIDENKDLKESRTKMEYQNQLLLETDFLSKLVNKSAVSKENKSEIVKSLKKIESSMKKFEKEKNNEFFDLEKETRTYRNLASLGISSATTSHEIKNIMTLVGEILKSMKKKIQEKPVNREQLEEDRIKIKEQMKVIRQFLALVGQYVTNIKDDFEELHEKSKLSINEILNNMSISLNAILKDKDISIVSKVYPEDLTVFMNKADFFSLTLNLLTNSIKALGIDSKQKDKQIQITVFQEAYDLKMLFSNNGPSIKDEEKNEIFKMFVTNYEEGTGLGLPIVREIVDEYKGKIIVSNEPEFTPGATFEIVIPIERLKK